TRQHAIEFVLGDRRAHSRLTHFTQRLLRIGKLELVLLEVLDAPANQIAEIHQVLVSGQDQLLRRPFRNALGTDLTHVFYVDVLDGPRQCDLQSRIQGMRELSERRDDRLLARSNLVNRAEAQPHQRDCAEGERKQRAPAGSLRQAEVSARPAEAPLGAFRTTLLEQVLDVRRTSSAIFRAATRQPGVTRSARFVLTGRRRRLVAGTPFARFPVARWLAPW